VPTYQVIYWIVTMMLLQLPPRLLSLLTTALANFMIITVMLRQLIILPMKAKTQAQNLDHPSSRFNLSRKNHSDIMTYQRTPSSDGNALAARTSIAKLERTATSVRRLESSLKMSTSPRLREEL
jgi:hypothetical protein